MSAILELPTVTLKQISKQPALKQPSCFGFRSNYELAENVDFVGKSTLALVKLPQRGKSDTADDAILKRFKQLGKPAGQLHAQRLLAQRFTVPEEWCQAVLFFPGTVWRSSRDGRLFIPYIFPDEHAVWELWKIWDILIIPKLRLGWCRPSAAYSSENARAVYLLKQLSRDWAA